MNELIAQIQNDSTLMLIVGISIAMFLVIFLILVISAMRIKGYKETYRSIKAKNIEIEEALSRLEKELKVYKITDQKNKKELQDASNTIARLEQDTKEYPALQISAAKTDNILIQTQEELKASYVNYKILQEKIEDLQARHNTLQDEQVKCRTNNARLLAKLESAKRK